MKDFVFVYTRDSKPVNAVLRTDLDHGDMFTVMQVMRPESVSVNVFPFRNGDVFNVGDIQKFVAMQNMGTDPDAKPTAVYVQNPPESEQLEIPEYHKVTITVTNEGATLKINGAVVPGLTWSDYIEKGHSVAWEASLTGFTTQTGKETVESDNITKSITLVATGG